MPTPWLPLTDAAQLAAIAQESHTHPVFIFKHSTTCSISAAAKAKVERQWPDNSLPADATIYYLDLLRFRPISGQIASEFGVEHQSPQLLLSPGWRGALPRLAHGHPPERSRRGPNEVGCGACPARRSRKSPRARLARGL
ncbi:MAG: bacillithiol system redox-active protein YtxJ [Hymenobacter sp.]